MATKPTLLRAVTVISILIIHPLLITSSHTLLRKRSDDIHSDQKFSIKEHHDYISTKILTKLIPASNTTNITSSSSSSSASPMACIHQENKLKKCYEKLPQSFNEIKCTQCIYGNVNPSTQVITCPHSDYCSSVSGCTKGVCPKECKVEFYEVLNCIWEKAGCASTAGVGDGECGVAKKKKKKGKKKVASDPYPSRGGTTATVAATTSTTTKAAAAVSSKNGSNNPCSECSTSEGGARHNFCGNLNVNPIQDACSSQTECSDRGLKCKVCTKIVNNNGYGGKSVMENVGSGAYVCVKDEEEEGDKKTAPAAAGKGGGNDITSAATSAASSLTSSSNTKKQKGADTAAVTTTTTSATGKKKQKGVTTTTTTTSSTTPAGGFCHSRAVVLGNCIFTKDTSPDCLNCIHSGTQEDSSDDPTCKQVQQHQFCTNIASCAKEHCGKCTFEFYTGLNCVLQKIPGCEQFSCAIGGGGIEGAISSSSGGVGGGYDASSDGYSLQQFRDDVERQCKMMNPRMEDEVFVREA